MREAVFVNWAKIDAHAGSGAFLLGDSVPSSVQARGLRLAAARGSRKTSGCLALMLFQDFAAQGQALRLAAIRGHALIVKDLLKFRLDARTCSEALRFARDNGHWEIVQTLLEHIRVAQLL